jgi:hypothetical protein
MADHRDIAQLVAKRRLPRGEIDTVPIGRLRKAVSSSLRKKLKLEGR